MIKGKKPGPTRRFGVATPYPGTHRFKGGGHNENEVADIIENALKLLADVKETGDVRVIQTRAARIALCLSASSRRMRASAEKVTIFGSARTQSDQVEYQQAVDSVQDCEKPFHGHHRRRPGHHAGRARRAPERQQFRCKHRLPWEQGANPVIARTKN